MRKLISAFVFLGVLLPTTSNAQQITNFPVCTNYQENYFRGGYDAFGNYVQGGVTTNSNNFNCVTKQPYPSQGYAVSSPAPYYNAPTYNGYYGYRRAYPYGPYGYNRANPFCNPGRTVLGATLGGSLGAAFSHKRSTRRWAVPLGAAIGGLAYSC